MPVMFFIQRYYHGWYSNNKCSFFIYFFFKHTYKSGNSFVRNMLHGFYAGNNIEIAEAFRKIGKIKFNVFKTVRIGLGKLYGSFRQVVAVEKRVWKFFCKFQNQ